MDQAALQWGSLEQSSGAPCRTAWGAREQHKSAYMVRQLVDGTWWLCLPTLWVSRCAGLDALHSSTLHTAMHCRSFRNDDILNVLNSSAVGTFSEPAKTRGWSHRIVWLHAICTTEDIFACFLFASVAYSWGVLLAELNHFAGLHFSPMKLGALHCLICDGCLEVFHWLAKLPVRHYRPPPLEGYLAQWAPRHSYSRRRYDSDSFPGGLLDKLIWEDAERGISCSPVLMYSFGTSHAKVDRQTV